MAISEIVKKSLFSVVKNLPDDTIEIEIGDSKQVDFKPQVKIMRWDNDVNFSMRAEEVVGSIVETEDGVVKYKTNKFEVHQYEKNENEFEFEWVLNKRPDTNILTATIQTKGLNFFYQDKLTQEEIELVGDGRPENVIGSYAVYHKTKKDNKYKCGKAFHIYRPKAIDSKGKEVWCDLNINEIDEILTVTVPNDFLDSATYPVVVDPTFGYTSLGGSTAVGWNSRLVAWRGAAPESGVINSLHYGQDLAGTQNVIMALYSAGTTNAALLGTTEERSIGAGAAFYTFNFSTEPSITASTTYMLVGQSSGDNNFRYDSTSGSSVWKYADFVYSTTLPDPQTFSSVADLTPSIYATYEVPVTEVTVAWLSG